MPCTVMATTISRQSSNKSAVIFFNGNQKLYNFPKVLVYKMKWKSLFCFRHDKIGLINN